MPSRVVVSLISRDKDWVGDQRSEVGDDFVVRQKSDKDDKEEIPSRGAIRGLKENKGLSKSGRYCEHIRKVQRDRTYVWEPRR